MTLAGFYAARLDEDEETALELLAGAREWAMTGRDVLSCGGSRRHLCRPRREVQPLRLGVRC